MTMKIEIALTEILINSANDNRESSSLWSPFALPDDYQEKD